MKIAQILTSFFEELIKLFRKHEAMATFRQKKRLKNYDSRMANNTIKYFVFAQFYIF